MARLILSLALLLFAEWVTCQSDSIRPGFAQEIITQDVRLLKRLDLLETKFLEYKYKIDALEIEKANFLQFKYEMEVENAKLTNLVAKLEKKIAAFEPKSDFSQEKISKELTKAEERGSYVPRTCQDLKSVDPSLPSGSYLIDPDGVGVGDAAIYVYCDMARSGTTFVSHDSEAPMSVSSCSDPGCYSRAVTYNATAKQMAALIDISTTCRQFFKYECLAAPFELDDIQYSFWNDRNGMPQYFWAGNRPNPPNAHTCQCGINGNCVDNLFKCNCDAMAPTLQNDNGYITDMDLLPVTKLNFGRTQLIGATGKHTLGRLECSGRAVVNGKPTSCHELFRLGHTLNGFYQVKGIEANAKKIEMIYCDFEQQPSSPKFENRLGVVDVKTSPVYFYVQRSAAFSLDDAVVSFQFARLNIGGAMNLTNGTFTAPVDGIYHFAFAGLKNDKGAIGIILRVNGLYVGVTDSGTHTTQVTLSLHSTLRLRTGDRVDLITSYSGGGILYDEPLHFTHFSGWLLEEDLPV